MSVEQWLEGDPQALKHAEGCPECAGLADDLGRIRQRVSALGPEGWAGAPAPVVDPEAALQALWAEVDRLPLIARRRRSRWALRAASTLAAAVLLFSFAAPSLLRWRIESSPVGTSLSSAPQHSAIFWTTANR